MAGLSFARIAWNEGEGEMTPNHRERQIMQRLRSSGWIKAFLIPDSPKTLQRLLAKGWIESQGTGTELASGPRAQAISDGRYIVA